MKALQTLGPGAQKGIRGIFFYRRIPGGIEIYDGDISTPSNASPAQTISNDEWDKILGALAGRKTLRLSNPNQDKGLYGILRRVKRYSPREMARIAAILHNEGSVESHGRGIPIFLRIDAS